MTGETPQELLRGGVGREFHSGAGASVECMPGLAMLAPERGQCLSSGDRRLWSVDVEPESQGGGIRDEECSKGVQPRLVGGPVRWVEVGGVPQGSDAHPTSRRHLASSSDVDLTGSHAPTPFDYGAWLPLGTSRRLDRLPDHLSPPVRRHPVDADKIVR